MGEQILRTTSFSSDITPLLHDDPLVRQVMETWTPRFLNAGIPIGDIARTVSQVKTWDDWVGAWMQTGHRHEERGDRLAAIGSTSRAAGAWLLASRCYHVGYHVATRDLDLHAEGLTRMLESHDKALPHVRPAVEKISVGDGADRIVGLLSLPPSNGPVPVAIFLPGLDSTKETRHGAAGGWVADGYAVISMDGPGQGEASRWSTIRPDYEVAVSAMIDWIVEQPWANGQRIALVGGSLAGYYAPRAACFEHRLAAVVGNCGPFDWAECWDLIPQVTRDAFQHYSGAADAAEAKVLAAELTLEGIADQITTPLLVVHGDRDPLIPWEQGKRIVDEASGPAEFVLVEGGNHVVNNFPYESGPVIREWVGRQLGLIDA